MYKVLYDCDNTMGMLNKDVDDGLTLMYLLGSKEVELMGVTSTHGNSSVEKTHSNTLKMMNYLGFENRPIFKGGDLKVGRVSEASKFLALTTSRYPKEVTVIATGSLTNLYGAYLCDENFYDNIGKIIIMGGITKPLIINGVKINELNLSCDFEASYSVLTSNADITIFNGHTSLQALFTEKEINKLKNNNEKIYRYINEKIKPWYELMEKDIGIKGFCNWDATTALYLTHKELFEDDYINICPNIENLKNGIIDLCDDNKGYKVNMPTKIKDLNRFNDILISTWGNLFS
ncbi:nucleoside hydrolase [Clostridium niameyense]|uniref:Nucleoside hydrolase n=1 Tax=Clostridium niameyense TaxID=1622073 RepID=A0A6M0R6V6_9CLOT|nr:nucleoside hydrolase [Clostridium niameyense]NEZ45931.1 nucleoside hydrolase [Clostridium niameyense]